MLLRNAKKRIICSDSLKQILSNFSQENSENISNCEGWALTLVAYKKGYFERLSKVKTNKLNKTNFIKVNLFQMVMYFLSI